MGKEISIIGLKTKVNKILNSNKTIIMNIRNDDINIVNSGVYFYKLNYSKTSKSKKMVLVK